ncbi:BslA/BslB family hydrophobin [Metabacillus fastidiosus]|uniref:BslA/BslB family hydrophobin n=1 Tax=Metabacillus fastidiosus TaxID=1458 RepID=UPI003D29B8D7
MFVFEQAENNQVISVGTHTGFRLHSKVGEDLTNGTIVLKLEGFTAKTTDLYLFVDKGWRNLNDSNVEITDEGKTITLKNISITPINFFYFHFNNVTVASGTYTLSITVDADGPGNIKTPSDPLTYQYTVN